MNEKEKNELVNGWAKKEMKAINEMYKKPENASPELVEYLKWRAEDNNKTVVLMIEYLALMGLLILLGILVLNLVGIIPHSEITKVCTVVESVKGVM